MELDYDKLKDEADSADQKRGWLNVAGSIGQSLSDTPSFYEIYKGKKVDGPNIKGVTDAAAGMIQDPMARQAKAFAAMKAIRDQKDVEQDTASDSSQTAQARAFATSLGLTVDPADTAHDLERRYGLKTLVQKKFSDKAEYDRMVAKMKAEQDFKSSQNDKDRQNDLAKERLKLTADGTKTPTETRLQKLSGTDKARYDNALMVLKAVDDMGGALDNGENTFSAIGDNNYTKAERQAAEAYGRMQSGGAINKDEEDRFLKMLPRATDQAGIQRSKLLGQREEMISRLKTLGFSPEEAGYSPREFAYGADPKAKANAAVAAPKPDFNTMSDAELRAYVGK